MKKPLKIALIVLGVIVGLRVLYFAGVVILALVLPDEETTEEVQLTEETEAPEDDVLYDTIVVEEEEPDYSTWAEYSFLEDAEEASGIDFSFAECIDCGVYFAQEYSAKAGMIDVNYYTEDTGEMYTIRQATLTDEDISDYDYDFDYDQLVDDCGITGIRLRGSEDGLAICSFNYGDCSYVIYPGSMSYCDTFTIIAEMTGTASALYGAADAAAPAPNTSAYDEWYAASAEFDDEYYEANDYGWGEDEYNEWSDPEEVDEDYYEANDYGWGEDEYNEWSDPEEFEDEEYYEANDYGWGDDEYNEWSDPGDYGEDYDEDYDW